MKSTTVRSGILALMTTVLCMAPMRAAAQAQQDDAAAKQRAIEEEAAKLKAAGPQRDHDEDAANWARISAERRAKAAAELKAASAAPTPHSPDGHPDLNGMWVSP